MPSKKPDQEQNPFEILGVAYDATEDEIKKAYRRLALANHPDKVGDEGTAKMQAVNSAYEMLKDAKLRAKLAIKFSFFAKTKAAPSPTAERFEKAAGPAEPQANEPRRHHRRHREAPPSPDDAWFDNQASPTEPRADKDAKADRPRKHRNRYGEHLRPEDAEAPPPPTREEPEAEKDKKHRRHRHKENRHHPVMDAASMFVQGWRFGEIPRPNRNHNAGDWSTMPDWDDFWSNANIPWEQPQQTQPQQQQQQQQQQQPAATGNNRQQRRNRANDKDKFYLYVAGMVCGKVFLITAYSMMIYVTVTEMLNPKSKFWS